MGIFFFKNIEELFYTSFPLFSFTLSEKFFFFFQLPVFCPAESLYPFTVSGNPEQKNKWTNESTFREHWGKQKISTFAYLAPDST